MNQEELLTYIDENLVINGKFYNQANIPSQISNAIYTFGDFSITDVLGFVDVSEELDGSRGMIITPNEIYFKFGQAGKIIYSEITLLSLEMHHQNPVIKAIIKSNEGGYAFSNKVINPIAFIELLSKVTGLEKELIMTAHEKVAYYVPIILNDIINDEYEDVVLTSGQEKQIKEFFKDLELINEMDDENYQYELEGLCKRVLLFVDELDLDSEEIDILIEIEAEFDKKDEQIDQQIDDAKKYYDDMVNKYQQGDSQMYEQLKSMMARLGIDESDLAGKSQDEIQDFLCERFGISKTMFEKMAAKFRS